MSHVAQADFEISVSWLPAPVHPERRWQDEDAARPVQGQSVKGISVVKLVRSESDVRDGSL
jgi:hypothetical protein